MRFDMRRIDHLHVGRSPTPGQFAKQVLPQPSTRPAHEAVIDGCRRAIFGRAIAPAASALENMHDPADDPAIVYPLHATHIPRQIRPNSSPLLVAQPKQILAHDPDPFPKTNQDRILRVQKLMSFDPSTSPLPAGIIELNERRHDLLTVFGIWIHVLSGLEQREVFGAKFFLQFVYLLGQLLSFLAVFLLVDLVELITEIEDLAIGLDFSLIATDDADDHLCQFGSVGLLSLSKRRHGRDQNPYDK